MPFAIRRVLWDQGESGTAIQGVDQYTLMGALIRGWRQEWGQGKLQGFALAGKDRQFVWADAVIVADTVVVSSDKVTEPAFVRYAWAQQHPWANLFNKDGLPALPFRTDN